MGAAYILNNCEAFTPTGAASQRVATIGFFDGVHTGHRYLLSQVERLARENSMAGMAVTFERHPRQVLQTDYCPVLLNTPEEKYRHLAESGIDACVMLDFTVQMAQLSARDFMRLFLRERYGVEKLVMGYDHRFGHERHLSLADYQAIGREVGIEVVQAEAFQTADLTVSSSAIRRLLQGGRRRPCQPLSGLCLRTGGDSGRRPPRGARLGIPNGQPAARKRLETRAGTWRLCR